MTHCPFSPCYLLMPMHALEQALHPCRPPYCTYKLSERLNGGVQSGLEAALRALPQDTWICIMHTS